MNEAQRIKDTLRERVEKLAHHLFPNGKREGSHWCVGDITGAPGTSFKICIAGSKAGIWGDFAGSEKHSANLLDLWMQARGVDFRTALNEAARWSGQTAPPFARSRAKVGQTFTMPRLTDKECERGKRMAERLRDDPNLCERIGRTRNWRGETIRLLATEASLGFEDGKLAFLYDTGAKLRWRQGNERIIRWAFGKPWLWRGAFLSRAETVYLCEGETDAITLIDAGIEDDLTTLVVALPSASTFNAEWASLFRRKIVILALDSDEAGQAATNRVSKLLRPHASRVKQLNWEGLQHAC